MNRPKLTELRNSVIRYGSLSIYSALSKSVNKLAGGLIIK